MSARYLARAAAVAALYTVATGLVFASFSFGPVQFRVAEMMTALPYLMPAAVPGLFVGCFLSNLLAGSTIWDVVFGSLATLAAAAMTRRIRNPVLALLPPVLVNAVVVGLVLTLTVSPEPSGLTFLVTAGQIGLSQAVICYGLGLPLIFLCRGRFKGLFE